MKIENWPLEKIKPYLNNPRKNESAVSIVAKSIEEYGWRQPITVDKEGVIIIGHTRLKAAQKLGLTTAPVHQALELSPDQVKALRIMDNKSNEHSEWIDELLIQEIGELSQSEFDLILTGFKQNEIDEILNGFNEDFSDKNREINVDNFEDEMLLVFKLSSDDFEKVKLKLFSIDENQETALRKALNCYE